MKTKIEIQETYKGYDYAVLAVPMGHRCGYVRIPSGHYLFEKHYSDKLEKPDAEEIKRQEMGKRGILSVCCWDGDSVSMDILFNVHGGITFAGKLGNLEGWWVGFDCGHYDDAKDPSIMDKVNRAIQEKYGFLNDGVVRTAEYVENECKSLIEQIKQYYD